MLIFQKVTLQNMFTQTLTLILAINACFQKLTLHNIITKTFSLTLTLTQTVTINAYFS